MDAYSPNTYTQIMDILGLLNKCLFRVPFWLLNTKEEIRWNSPYNSGP